MNQSAIPDKYPLPKVDDLLASLGGGKSFTKLHVDLAHAYQQLVLDEDLSKLTTINTHRGLYQYKRIPFGISAAPAIFQCTMESLLQGIPKVCVHIDDILVTGIHVAEEDHLANLTEVLRRMSTSGMQLKHEKCAFIISQVHNLGHTVSSEGIQPRRRSAPSETHLHPKTFINSNHFSDYATFTLSSRKIYPLF